MPAWWVGRSPAAMAESLRDLLTRMFRAEIAYVRLRDPATGGLVIAESGATARAVEAAINLAGGIGGRPQVLIDGEKAPTGLAVAMIGTHGQVGCLAVGANRPSFPSDLDTMLVKVSATQIAVALQYAEVLARHESAEQRLRGQARLQSTVAELEHRALSGNAIATVLDEASLAVRNSLQCEFSEVLELSPDGTGLRMRAGAGWRPGSRSRTDMQAGAASLAGFTLTVKEPVLVFDIRDERRFSQAPLHREHGVVSGINVVIPAGVAAFGVVGAHARAQRTFSADDTSFMQGVANVLAAALQRSRVEAERDELLARTAAAHAESQKMSQAKSDFLAMMSHELRTPLNAIGGYGELLEMEVHGPLTDGQRADVTRLLRSQRYLLGLINNVLTFMKLDAGRASVAITRVLVDDTIALVEDLVRPQMDAKQLRYEFSCAGSRITVSADSEKLQQILVNLLSNATKFTEASGTIRVDCSVAPESVTIRVQDSGCGIPRESITRVFEPFVQIDDGRAHRGEGTGLGLTISRDLARAMGGDITLESEVGHGSTFSLTLPRAL
ncbi:MAG: sensor protein [Gemmatimonadetes bacterium]|nr:sensor protein [Gemmatimonadota bacterium]